MKIDVSSNCTTRKECDTYTPIALETDKSVKVEKTNTLHQFDTVGIVGVQSPVGKVPIVFYVKEGPGRGRRGIVYFDDLDSVCYMFPESEHAEWCSQPYDMKYDALEPWDNGVERGLKRNHGIFELWASVYRKWYNGQVMYRPFKKIQGCGHDFEGYPSKDKEVVVKEKVKKKSVSPVIVKKKVSPGCGCQKGK